MTVPANALALPDAERERIFTGLVAKVNGGHDDAAKHLLALCTTYPELWKRIASLEQMAIDSWLQVLAPGTGHQPVFNRASILEELARLRTSLVADAPSPLEQLLISRILSAWLQVLAIETRYAQKLSATTSSLAARDHWQKATERAQKQLLRAIQSLATTRRLLHPTTVNIAQNQINIAS